MCWLRAHLSKLTAWDGLPARFFSFGKRRSELTNPRLARCKQEVDFVFL